MLTRARLLKATVSETMASSMSARSVSMWRIIVGSFKQEARQAVLNQPGLEQVLILIVVNLLRRCPQRCRLKRGVYFFSIPDFDSR
jgi:hypothetical protein